MLQVLRAGGEQVVDLPLGKPIHKWDGHIPIKQQPLARVGMGDVGKLVLGNTKLLCQDRPVTLGLGQQDHKIRVVQNVYFYAVDTQNYDLYVKQINPLYQTSLESLMQEKYGYGMENSMEQLHQNLVNYAGSDDFTIESMELAQAQEVLAEDYDADTNFVQEYLNAYTQAFGEDFTKQLDLLWACGWRSTDATSKEG